MYFVGLWCMHETLINLFCNTVTQTPNRKASISCSLTCLPASCCQAKQHKYPPPPLPPPPRLGHFHLQICLKKNCSVVGPPALLRYSILRAEPADVYQLRREIADGACFKKAKIKQLSEASLIVSDLSISVYGSSCYSLFFSTSFSPGIVNFCVRPFMQFSLFSTSFSSGIVNFCVWQFMQFFLLFFLYTTYPALGKPKYR